MPCIMADWGLQGLLSPLLPDTSSWRPRPEPAIALLGSLALLFIWYCYRVGSGQAAPISHQQGVPTEERCPRRALRGDAVNQRLYRSLRDYAKRYSWSGMNRLHKGIRDQAHYQLGERLAIQKPSTFYLPDLPSAPYFPRESQRHDVEILELSFPAILREFEGIAWDFTSGALAPRGWTTNTHPGWHSYYLYRQGECIAPNCRSCPWTYRALSALRTFVNANRFGNACFSVLQPGTVLPGTYGPTNTRVRCHLGLKVPSGCELVVGGEPQCWSEGYCLLVDDSFLHTTAHNGSPTDGSRVIFIVDLWHPNVAGPERQALDYIFAPGRACSPGRTAGLHAKTNKPDFNIVFSKSAFFQERWITKAIIHKQHRKNGFGLSGYNPRQHGEVVGMLDYNFEGQRFEFPLDQGNPANDPEQVLQSLRLRGRQ